MSSPQKIEANRANGQLSHGPLTDATKKISSRNAIKHGFTGKTIRISPDEVERYDAHLLGFYDHYQPVGAPEKTLCQQLADLHWTLNQISVDQLNASALLDDMIASLKFSPLTSDPVIICERTQPQYRAINNLGIYEQRKRRAAVLVENQLQAMQKDRLDKMPKPAENSPEAKQESYAAAVSSYDGGFVRSLSDLLPTRRGESLTCGGSNDQQFDRRMSQFVGELREIDKTPKK
jgi:hypothetical protein